LIALLEGVPTANRPDIATRWFALQVQDLCDKIQKEEVFSIKTKI